MLTVKEKGILTYIIEHCRRIEEKVEDATRETLETNKDIEEIICFNIFQIGELVKHIPTELLAKYNGMPWDDIKGMRDWVGHGYGSINLDDVWKTASEDILPLRIYCQDIIELEGK